MGTKPEGGPVAVRAQEGLADEKAAVRAAVFGHLAGMVVAPVMKALRDRGVFQLDFRGGVPFESIVEKTHGNRAYLRVALRILRSCGWLECRCDIFTLTAKGETALHLAPAVYDEVVRFIPLAIFLEDFLLRKLQGSILPSLQLLISRAKEGWDLPPETDHPAGATVRQIRLHADGVLIGPAMVALARGGVFERLERGPTEIKSLPGDQSCLAAILELLAAQGWVTRVGNKVSLTSAGAYAAQIATAYGVTVSYLPTFTVVSTLLFGNARIPRLDDSGVELLVNRAMNVWGSGGAHRTYFNKVDEIIIELFNRPVQQQPKGICDMGCGDGAFLEHLYSVVRYQTERGKVLDKYPLILIGADFNKVARRLSSQRLRKAGVPSFHVIHGDINRPAQLASAFEELGHDAHDFLHVRSFLDHNRPWVPPSNYEPGARVSRTTGVFAHLGEAISPDELEENLVRHLRRWAPYAGRFGLLVLELHTLPAEITARNLDRTPTIAYDGTHGFSDQYLVELPVFLECAREAGFAPDMRYQARFPPSDLATVSINFFSAPG